MNLVSTDNLTCIKGSEEQLKDNYLKWRRISCALLLWLSSALYNQWAFRINKLPSITKWDAVNRQVPVLAAMLSNSSTKEVPQILKTSGGQSRFLLTQTSLQILMLSFGKIILDQVLTVYKAMFLLYHGKDLLQNPKDFLFMEQTESDHLISLKGL